PVAELHPAEQLALEPGQVREADEQHVDDDDRLDDRDPPGLVHALTSTVPPCRPAACSSGTRATPARTALVTRARSWTEVPLCETVTVAPFAIPRLRASARESEISAPGRWNCSSSIRSTAGPEKSGL